MANEEEDKDKSAISWKQVIRDFLQLLMMAILCYNANVGSRNNDGIKQSNDGIKQVEGVQSSVVIKQGEAAKVAGEVRTKLEQKIEEDNEILGGQLYTNWKYLEDVAYTGDAKDKIKAAEAKRAYDNHNRKFTKKP